MNFKTVFGEKGADQNRGKFLSRIFGIFSEEIVRIWTRDPNCQFEDIGRPTIINGEINSRYTIDFCFREKSTNAHFASEMKCEIEYENYKYFSLEHSSQLNHHKKEAFKEFLEISKNPKSRVIKVNAREISINGGILVWGTGTEDGRELVKNEYKFHSVLFVSDMINDLISWKNSEYIELLCEREKWNSLLFQSLRNLN